MTIHFNYDTALAHAEIVANPATCPAAFAVNDDDTKDERMWGLVLLACFVGGAIATVIALRVSSHQKALQFAHLLEARQIVWGGQVRWKRGRAWGASGSILLSPDGILAWTPDASSLKRGSHIANWAVSEVAICLLGERRDISGLHFNEYRIATPDRTTGRFGMFHEVGSRPEQIRTELS